MKEYELHRGSPSAILTPAQTKGGANFSPTNPPPEWLRSSVSRTSLGESSEHPRKHEEPISRVQCAILSLNNVVSEADNFLRFVREGNLRGVERALAGGADIDGAGVNLDFSPLVLATDVGLNRMAKLLLRRRANVDVSAPRDVPCCT